MAKRGRNEGTIRRRADGRYEARIILGRDPGTGKPIRKSIYGKTQREVRKAMQQLQVDLENGVYTEPSKLTVSQWIDIWLAEYCPDIKKSTRLKYLGDIDNHIRPGLGATKLSTLTKPIVQHFVNSLQKREKPLSAASVHNIHGTLHTALEEAVSVGYIRSNPATGCKLPRIEKPEIQPLDLTEIRAFLAALEDNEYGTLLKVDLFTGMRQGEILGLQWECVDFAAGTITIRKQLSRPREKGAQFELTSPKNGKTRVLQPAPFVMDLLREHRRQQLEQRLKLGSIWDDEGFPDLVFTTQTGSHLNYNIVLRHLHRAMDAAGIERRRFHDLRHTYAVTALQAGDDVKTVQEALGHYSAGFTLDTYVHVTQSMKKASAQRMEAVINSLK